MAIGLTNAPVDIRGVIEEYIVAAGENISARTFVEFITKPPAPIDPKVEADINVDTTVDSTGYYTVAVVLSENKVFIPYDSGSTSPAHQLMGVVCTISGDSFTFGTPQVISATEHAGYCLKAVALSESKVFVAHSAAGGHPLSGIICTITGDSFTFGADIVISSTAYTAEGLAIAALSETKVFIAHSSGSTTPGNRLMGLICTVSGNTFTMGTDTELNSETYSGYYVNMAKLSDSKMAIVHSSGTTTAPNSRVMVTICTISGTTITFGSRTVINEETYSGFYTAIVALSDSKIFVAHNIGRTLAGTVCDISGTTLTAGETITINSTGNSARYLTATAISEDRVFIAHSSGATTPSNYLMGIICYVSGNTFTFGVDTTLKADGSSGMYFSVAPLSDERLFMSHGSGLEMPYNHLMGAIIKVAEASTEVAPLKPAGEYPELIEDKLISDNVLSSMYMSVTALSDTKVFIAHGSGSETSPTQQLYGVVCEITENGFTFGADRRISAAQNSAYALHAVALSETKVLVTHSSGLSTSPAYQLKAIICEISGTTITFGSDYTISAVQSTGYYFSAIKLTDSKVFIVYASGSTSPIYQLRGVVCSISGTAISVGTDAVITAVQNAGRYASGVALSESTVFIAHSSGNGSPPQYRLMGVICSISGTSFAIGTDTVIDSSAQSGISISVAKLSASKVFIAHNSQSPSTNWLKGIICTIVSGNIAFGEDIPLTENGGTAQRISTVTLSDSKVAVTHGDSTRSPSDPVVIGIYTIDDTTIALAGETIVNADQSSSQFIGSAALSGTKIFVIHGSGSATPAQRLMGALVSLYQTDGAIKGVARTAGAEGDTIQIYVPKT